MFNHLWRRAQLGHWTLTVKTFHCVRKSSFVFICNGDTVVLIKVTTDWRDLSAKVSSSEERENPVKSDSRGHRYSSLFEVPTEGHLIPTSKESGVFETPTRQAIVGAVDVCVFVFLRRHLSRASGEPFKRLQQRTSVCVWAGLIETRRRLAVPRA